MRSSHVLGVLQNKEKDIFLPRGDVFSHEQSDSILRPSSAQWQQAHRPAGIYTIDDIVTRGGEGKFSCFLSLYPVWGCSAVQHQKRKLGVSATCCMTVDTSALAAISAHRWVQCAQCHANCTSQGSLLALKIPSNIFGYLFTNGLGILFSFSYRMML